MRLLIDVTTLPHGQHPGERALFYRCAHTDWGSGEVTWTMHVPMPFKLLVPNDYGRSFWYGKAVYAVMLSFKRGKVSWFHHYLTVPKPELRFGRPKKTPINRWNP